MKRALLIGIDDYDNFSDLTGCVTDAKKMRDMLKFNEDGTTNYDCRLITSRDPKPITGEFITTVLDELFYDFTGEILVYFSGHGAQKHTGNQIATQNGNSIIAGIDMDHLLLRANKSSAREVVLILDACYAGALGDPEFLQGNRFVNQTQLREGVTILAASSSKGVAKMVKGRSVFTDLLLGALAGGAADVRGRVSAASIYAYIDQSLGAWDQRPMYKSYASRMTHIRRCIPPVPDEGLMKLPVLFKTMKSEYRLDPTYEETHESAIKENVEIFRMFKLLRDARLLRTVNGDDLYFAALRSNSVKLTPLGHFYWRLANNNRL